MFGLSYKRVGNSRLVGQNVSEIIKEQIIILKRTCKTEVIVLFKNFRHNENISNLFFK